MKNRKQIQLLNQIITDLFYRDKHYHESRDFLIMYSQMLNGKEYKEKDLIAKTAEEFIALLIEKLTLQGKLLVLDKKVSIKIYDKWVSQVRDAFPKPETNEERALRRVTAALKLKCPACKSPLTFCDRKQYETLLEHVTDCNGWVSYKDSYTCSNKSCPCSDTYRWLEDGEGPYEKRGFNQKVDWIKDNKAPFGSYHRSYNASQPRKIVSFNLTKSIKVDFKVQCPANDNGNHKWWLSRYDFDIWIDHILYIPGINLLKFNLKEYFCSKQSRINHFKNYIEDNDNHWWDKLAFNIARTFFPKDYKAAIS